MENTKSQNCTLKCEKSLKDLLCSLENRFKKHLAFFKTNLEIQKNIIDSMWVLSQRFLILTRGAVCVRPYPREQTAREEREIRAEFKIKKNDVYNSNCKLTASLEDLKQMCRIFDRTVAKTVDPSLPSQIIDGNNKRKPIFYFIEFYADFLKFFENFQNELRLLGKILYVDDIKSILEYKNNLEPDKCEMDYFEKSVCEPFNEN